MKLQITSDIHCDKYKNNIFGHMVTSDPVHDVDNVLILVGDISHAVSIERHYKFFQYLSRKFKKILYIPGNHEYYNNFYIPIEESDAKIRFFLKKFPNFVYLQNESIIIDDCLISGSTLWFEPENMKLNEWFRIPVSPIEIQNRYEYSMAYLQQMNVIAKRDGLKHIVATHYPHNNLTSRPVRGTTVNFNLPLSPDVWISGHTHRSEYFTITSESNQSTIMMSNQRRDMCTFTTNFVIDTNNIQDPMMYINKENVENKECDTDAPLHWERLVNPWIVVQN